MARIYTTASFSALIEKTDMTKYGDIVPFETAQIDGKLIVPFEMAQIPNVLFATGLVEFCKFLKK